MVHILLGDSDGDVQFLLEGRTSKPFSWVVPKKSEIGDQVMFFLPSHGFVGCGEVSSVPLLGERRRYRARIRKFRLFATIVPPAFIKDNRPVEWMWPTYTKNYTTIDGAIETKLNELLESYQATITGEIPLQSAGVLVEGKSTYAWTTIYERNPIARRDCINHYGQVCNICKFSFGETYGEYAEGYIHIHHLKAISQREREHVVDPIRDLRPVCPNCHAIIHLRTPPYSIREVKKMIAANKS